MKDLEYGKGYKYAHNEADAIADMSCLPSALEGRKYYEPKEEGSRRRSSGASTDGKRSRRSDDPELRLSADALV
jgi:putative ATPase